LHRVIACTHVFHCTAGPGLSRFDQFGSRHRMESTLRDRQSEQFEAIFIEQLHFDLTRHHRDFEQKKIVFKGPISA